MSTSRCPPGGWSLALICLACSIGPLLLLGLRGADLGMVETLLFGVSAGNGTGHFGFFPGQLGSALADALSAMAENLFLLAVAWAQPAQLIAHLYEVESSWVNPVTVLLGLLLLLWPVGVAAMAAVRRQPLEPGVRTLLLLLAIATGLAPLLPPSGPMLVVAISLLPWFVIATRRALGIRFTRSWVGPVLQWTYLGALALDLTIAVWLVTTP